MKNSNINLMPVVIVTTDGDTKMGLMGNPSFVGIRNTIGALNAEMIGMPDGIVMMVDQDGGPKKLPVNIVATALRDDISFMGKMPTPLFGDVAIFRKAELETMPFEHENGNNTPREIDLTGDNS